MASDWHTVEGKAAMSIGKKWEGKLFKKLVELDADAEWIAEDSAKWYAGHDIVWRGYRVEVKSNGGVDEMGFPYPTVCVEKVTKAGYTVGWLTSKSDVVMFINRAKSVAYMYNSEKLAAWIAPFPTFERWGAKCITMPWMPSASDVPDAGFMGMMTIP
jgi:hypothetical protein